MEELRRIEEERQIAETDRLAEEARIARGSPIPRPHWETVSIPDDWSEGDPIPGQAWG